MRRPYQFSLKWLLGLFFWLAVLGGWLSFLRDTEQSAEQRRMEQQAERLAELGLDGQ